MAAPTGALVVSASVKGKVVWYTVHVSESDKTKIKSTRFSELDDLHGHLAKEVPSFPGRLPPKTLRRQCGTDFVENRRKAIEVYLRLVATNPVTSSSTAWAKFFPDNPGTPRGTPSQSFEAPGQGIEKGEASEDEGEALNNTVNDEMGAAIRNKRDELKSAAEAKQNLEANVTSGDDALQVAAADAASKATLEAESAARLRSHRLGLEELDAALAAKKIKCIDKEGQQNELAKKFTAKLSSVSEAVKNAHTSFETARRAHIEYSAKLGSTIAAAVASKYAAESANGAAVENHAAMTAAMNVLQERAKTRLEDAKHCEREVDIAKMAKKSIGDESTAAEAARRKFEAESTAAAAALVSHSSDSARRARAHAVEVRRAQERAAHSATLRDMRTRGILMGEDRNSMEPAELAATDTAEADAEAVARAIQLSNDSKASDETQLLELEAAAAKTQQQSRKRDTIAAALAARLKDNEGVLQQVSAKHAAALAAHKVVQQELDAVKARVEGPLADALPVCAAKLTEATKALAAVKSKGEDELTPLRHAEEAEGQLLKEHQTEEAKLVQVLDEAQMAAAEAHEDVPNEENKENQGPDINFIVKSSEARCADRRGQAQAAAAAYKEAASAVQAAVSELASVPELSPPDDDDDDDYDDDWDEDMKENDEIRASLGARIEDLRQVAQEREEANKAAQSAMAAAKAELDDLVAQQKAMPKPSQPLTKLVREELAIVDAGLKTHNEKEGTILAEAKQKEAAWIKEKETLGADLHRAQLQVAAAKGDLTAAESLAKALKGQKSP